jgi:hypothetical protein
MFATASLQPLFKRLDMAPRKDTHRRASDADDIIKERLQSGAPPNDPQLEADMKTASGLSRVVDMRVPVWHIVVALTMGVGTLVGMYYTLQVLSSDMREVKVMLRANDASASAVREELAVQKFRMATIDAEIAALKAARYRGTP